MSEPFSYDRVHYPSMLYHVTRPDHLEVFGRLFGLAPRPVPEARVLEIGCGVGDNLLLAAECFPKAHFVGVDLGASQIAAGVALQRAAGIENVELRALDLTTIDESFGTFDYIVAHGVYSWLPAPVREALLEVVRARLAPQGVAFVSHLVNPGFLAKALAGGIMRYGTRAVAEPAAKIAAARRYLDLVVTHATPGERLYHAALTEQAREVAERRDDVLFHDELEGSQEGAWLWQTAERFAAHGLQFIADADSEMLGTAGLTVAAIRAMEDLSTTVIEREQQLDFLRNRTLRLSLLCHAGASLARPLRPERLADLHVGLDPHVEEITAAGPDAPLVIRSRTAQMQVDDALGKGILVALGRAFPGTVPIADLPAGPRAAAKVLDLYRTGFLDLSARPPTFATSPPARPRACALARVAAAGSSRVPNLRHTYSVLDDEARRALPLLDGRPDHGADAALLQRLCGLALLLPD